MKSQPKPMKQLQNSKLRVFGEALESVDFETLNNNNWLNDKVYCSAHSFVWTYFLT